MFVAIVSLAVALQVPAVGLDVTRDVEGGVRLTGPNAMVGADSQLVFVDPAGARLAFAAKAIADDAGPLAGERDRPLHWRRIAALARMLGTGRAELHYVTADGDTRTYRVPAQQRALLDLPLRHWSAWTTALIALLLGQWVWIVKHDDWPSRQFALMSAGLFLAAVPLAAGGDAPLVAPLFRWLLALNGLGAMVFGAGLIGMLARFPQVLLPQRFATGTLIAGLCVAAAQTFELVQEGGRLIGLACAAMFATMLILLVAQCVAAHADPVARRAARIIAASTGTAMSAVFVITILPLILRVGQPVHTAMVFPLILIVHAGVALAVTRTGLMPFDGWTRPATLRAGADVALVVLDLAMVTGAWALGGIRIAAVAAALAFVHVAARALLRRRRDAIERARDRDLLTRITQLSLAVDPQQRQFLWREALRLAFAPLDIAADPSANAPAPERLEGGLALRVPRTIATEPLILSHAEHGLRRFGAAEVERASQLLTLLTTTTRARDDYVRGVTEERLRIARDLHDDVGARLMTSLHRRDGDTMRQDINDAIADIRSIVGSLSGEARPLGDLLADIRHEALARLASAGLAVRWPVAPLELTGMVAATDARHLTSILRELASNTIRHAGATEVRVSLTASDAVLRLRYADDGTATGDRGAGNGLDNLMRRAEALGGGIVLTGPPAFTADLWMPRRATSREDGMADDGNGG